MKKVVRQIRSRSSGDLVEVCWFDASIGKSLSGSMNSSIDVPACSWAVFLGLLGEKNKHIILAQNAFKYSDTLYDIDYTAVPASWAVNAKVLVKDHVKPDEVSNMLTSFLSNAKRSFERKVKQQKARNHE